MYFQRTIRVLLCELEKGLVQLRDNLRSTELGDFGICIANEFNGCFRGSDSLGVANFLKFGQILVCCFHLLGISDFRYGTAQMQLDARAYITRGFFTCCPCQPVGVPAYIPIKG